MEIQQEFLRADVTKSQQATFGVNVTDVTGNLVSGSASTIVHHSDYYAGIRSEYYVAVEGEPLILRAQDLRLEILVELIFDAQPAQCEKAVSRTFFTRPLRLPG